MALDYDGFSSVKTLKNFEFVVKMTAESHDLDAYGIVWVEDEDLSCAGTLHLDCRLIRNYDILD